jgi:tRNA(Ser,Leu) C12 N-acetylase TAN1
MNRCRKRWQSQQERWKKKEKEETGAEKYRRISAEKEEKKIKSVKRAAKGLIKKKIKKMTAYFGQS